MKTFASLCIILGVLFVGATWASEAAPFALRLATNGDVALGGGDVSLGLRIHKEGWTGTITGEPILEGGASQPSLDTQDAYPTGTAVSPAETVFRMKDDSGAVCVTGCVAIGTTRFQRVSDTQDACRISNAILSLRATALTDIRAECVAMEFTIPAKDMAGLEWRAGDAARGVFPERYGELRLWRGMTDSFSFVDPETRKPVELRFPQPMSLLLQDSRLWGPNFSVRIVLDSTTRFQRVMDTQDACPTISFDCEISHPDGIAVEHDEIVTIAPGPDWTPLENRKNIVPGSALDFSAMGWTGAPAGKHGWLKVVDGHFEFEGLPGVEQRFYGVNLCETANFPDHAMSEELVARLKRLGYNSIRFHHHDDALAEVFLTQRRRDAEERECQKSQLSINDTNENINLCDSAALRENKNPVNPVNPVQETSAPLRLCVENNDVLDRFDYLAAVAMENGLYLTTDLYVSRKVSWRDIGFDRDGFVPDNCFKSLVALHEPAFKNWKAFTEAFLLHENPYTGRRYIDEPGMPLICLINEGPMKWAWNDIKKMDCMKAKWKEWRDCQNHQLSINDTNQNTILCASVSPCETSFDWASIPSDPSSIANFLDSAAAQCFAAEMERRAFEREKEFLVSLGCKALLTSQNCSDDQAMASLRETYDYVDNHFYHGNPLYLGKLWSGAFRCDGGNPVKADGLSLVNAAYARISGKPYTVTEWNFAGPGRFRSVGGLLAGAMAARQEWSGLWRFAYSHEERGLADGYGAPHLFDLAVDPVNQASERAVMCLFLRGDMAPLQAKVALDVGAPRITPDGKPAANRPEWMDEAWRLQVGRVSDKTNPVNPVFKIFALDDVLSTPPVAPQHTPDFAIDRESGTVRIATPRTCGVFAEGGAHEAGALRVKILAQRRRDAEEKKCQKHQLSINDTNENTNLCASVSPCENTNPVNPVNPVKETSAPLHLCVENNSATVFASSLDGAPLETSSRILVTHLTDAQAEGNVFADRARSVLLKWGRGRTLVRNGAARVSLALDHPESCEVWGLATDGARMERVPAAAENGRLSFTADVDSGRGARMFYEIWRKP